MTGIVDYLITTQEHTIANQKKKIARLDRVIAKQTWRRFSSSRPPQDRTPVILAFLRRDTSPACWVRGEARYIDDQGESYNGWWWANTDPGDYHADRLEITYGGDTDNWYWMPMPDMPNPKKWTFK